MKIRPPYINNSDYNDYNNGRNDVVSILIDYFKRSEQKMELEQKIDNCSEQDVE